MHCELALITGFQLGMQKAPYLKAIPIATLTESWDSTGRTSLSSLKMHFVPGKL